MRALFISDTLPYPPNNGKRQRIYHMLRGVARGSEVTLVARTPLIRGEEERARVDPLRQFCREVHLMPPDSRRHCGTPQLPRWRIWWRRALDHLHPTTPALSRCSQSTIGKLLLNRLCSESFDLVWAETLVSMALLPGRLGCRVLVDLDDIQHRWLAHKLREATWDWLLPIYALEFLKLRRVERNLRKLPYEFMVCSDADRRFFNGSGRVWVVPNGVELPSEPPSESAAVNRATLLFVGTMCYVPNVDAVRFFAKTIFPLIRRQVPDARFLIVGHEPTESVQGLESIPGVTVTGAVASVESYLSQATVVVAPIRFGGGTRIKILEAMGHRKAVVSTTVGAEGIEVQSGKHLLLADGPAAFAEACLLLLRDTALRDRISNEAYSLVRENYTWDRIERQIAGMVCTGTGRIA